MEPLVLSLGALVVLVLVAKGLAARAEATERERRRAAQARATAERTRQRGCASVPPHFYRVDVDETRTASRRAPEDEGGGASPWIAWLLHQGLCEEQTSGSVP